VGALVLPPSYDLCASAASGHFATRAPTRAHPLAVKVLPWLPMVMMPHLCICHPDIMGGGAHRRRERERQDRKRERDKTENPFHAFLPLILDALNTTTGFQPNKQASARSSLRAAGSTVAGTN
jgi:hypothetical protein